MSYLPFQIFLMNGSNFASTFSQPISVIPVKHLVVSGDEGIFASKELRAASPLHPLAVCGFTVTVI